MALLCLTLLPSLTDLVTSPAIPGLPTRAAAKGVGC
jgi:hypothetical protein